MFLHIQVLQSGRTNEPVRYILFYKNYIFPKTGCFLNNFYLKIYDTIINFHENHMILFKNKYDVNNNYIFKTCFQIISCSCLTLLLLFILEFYYIFLF